jgi:vancomycin resistance protein VanW
MFSLVKRVSLAVAVQRRRIWRQAQDAWREPNFAQWQTTRLLPFVAFRHRSPLLRKLAGVDGALQRNKVQNLTLAVAAIDGLRIRPGELFSFWERVGEPSAERGFQDGLVFEGGKMSQGAGGGLCQLANLLHWMFLHADLAVMERHHHAVDPFPDDQRTLPFGTGATVYFPFLDLRAANTSSTTYQLHVWVDGTFLHGEIRTEAAPTVSFRIVEREHRFVRTAEGVFRENQIWRVSSRWDPPAMFSEGLVAKNRARVAYPLPPDIHVES